MTMLPPHALAVAGALLLLPAVGLACINDSDTLRDEIQGRASTMHVITGQVAQHGAAYYALRLKRTRSLLARAPNSLEGLYDAAGAHMRLGGHDAALRHLERAESVSPGRYKTHSNLGVAFLLRADAGSDRQRRLADYDRALEHTQQALAVRPNAHFDAGWLFARMVTWKRAALDGVTPTNSMLGVAYAEIGRQSILDAAELRADKHGDVLDADFDGIKQLVSLLRGHPEFAEGYLVLGRNLQAEKAYHPALWAYVRASELGHPCQQAIQDHISSVFKHWQSLLDGARGRRHRVMPQDSSVASIRDQLRAAKRWLITFQATETALSNSTGVLPEFKAVLALVRRDGVRRMTPVAAGFVRRDQAGKSRRTPDPVLSAGMLAGEADDTRAAGPSGSVTARVPEEAPAVPNRSAFIALGVLGAGLGLAISTGALDRRRSAARSRRRRGGSAGIARRRFR